jgi:signal transduction histidine kinase
MIPNYKTSETLRSMDGAAFYKNEQWQQHLQKEIGVTKLAGGIAHHFNNLLAIVIGYGPLLQMKMEPDNPLRIYVEHILSSSEMAADLTKKLLILSGEHKMSLRVANLNETVRGVERHLPLFINNNIKLRVKLTDRDLPVMIDASHFEEALVDLISNAVDAMPLGGTLTVTTERLTLGSDIAERKGNGRSKERALLTVSDTGFGMTRKVKERVFDPFFTTKEV